MPSRSVICVAGTKRVIALVEELAPVETPQKRKRIAVHAGDVLGA